MNQLTELFQEFNKIYSPDSKKKQAKGKEDTTDKPKAGSIIMYDRQTKKNQNERDL
ncbi:hypothetical protein LCGC14_0371210 [marine sediment metagenome]|uniref:Uncharacterized protein n=1 Tax=marine sediment metagenome TaxID=412755 RepID=A0A0F9T5E5_9ZZZZ|nr:hypothetical protein [Maribacter sp.]